MTISGLSGLGADVVEAAYGHAVVPLAPVFRLADCLCLTRESCGVCAKFASESHGAITQQGTYGEPQAGRGKHGGRPVDKGFARFEF